MKRAKTLPRYRATYEDRETGRRVLGPWRDRKHGMICAQGDAATARKGGHLSVRVEREQP